MKKTLARIFLLLCMMLVCMGAVCLGNCTQSL